MSTVVEVTGEKEVAASPPPSIDKHDGVEIPPATPASDAEPPTRSGKINLIPRPSADPRDPLNWSFKRKALVAAAVYLAVYAGKAGPFNGQAQLTQQATTYHRPQIDITYFNSASSAGLLSSSWFWYPLSKKFGRSSVTLLCLICLLGTQIWSLNMTHADEYWPFFMSKFMAGFFGQVSQVLAPLYLVDMFFLHQRGRAFTILGISEVLGSSSGPSFSAFMTAFHPWYIEYYWTIGLVSFAILFTFIFYEETAWDRTEGATNYQPEGSWLERRKKIFFPGTAVVKPPTLKEIWDAFWIPIRIAFTPVLLLACVFDMQIFGYWVALNALSPVWLQKPVAQGGWGFTQLDNAGYTMIHWINLIVSQIYGHYISDRLPLWLAARNGGKWKPEYRLHALWFPCLVLYPIGLGLVGISLQYHTHWIVMGVGNFLVTFGAFQSIPVTINYISECFRGHTTEAQVPLASMRMWLGLSINFYINPWISAVGFGWVYGMMAFFSVGGFFAIIALMFWGHKIRAMSPYAAETEEGERIIGSASSSSVDVSQA